LGLKDNRLFLLVLVFLVALAAALLTVGPPPGAAREPVRGLDRLSPAPNPRLAGTGPSPTPPAERGGGDAALHEFPNDVITFSCRDAITDAPVPGLELVVVRRRDGEVRREEVVLSDSGGWVSIPASDLKRVAPSANSGFETRGSLQDLLRSGVLIVFRVFVLSGEIRFDGELGGLDPPYADVRLDILHFMPRPEYGRRPPAEWLASSSRMRERRYWQIGIPRVPGDVDADTGKFEFRVPQIPGGTLAANAAGWRPVSLELPASPEDYDGLSPMLLVFHRATRLSGRLLDDAGRPVTSCGIQVHGLGEGDQISRWFKEAQVAGGGAGIFIPSQDAAYFHMTRMLTTRADGRFEFYGTVDGVSLSLIAYVPGYAPLRVEAGVLHSDQTIDLRLHPCAPPDRRIQIRFNEWPLRESSLTLLDCTNQAQQTQAELVMDENGTVSSCWFEMGRLYAIIVQSRHDFTKSVFGHLRWDGRDLIDVSSLPRRLAEVR
jgi:hypothetical protein